jgi:hypothetical protein
VSKYGFIRPIHKKRDMICDNYRAVTLLCTAYTILANNLYLKLVPYAAEIIGEYQGGFQRGTSTVDQIFIMSKYCNRTEMYVICLLIFKHHITLWRKDIWSEIRCLKNDELICAKFKVMKYMLRLKLVNIYPLNVKLTKV